MENKYQYLKDTFVRRFEFSFLEIGFSRMLSSEITLPNMCFLECLINELNIWKCFAYFQKHTWQKAVGGSGLAAACGGLAEGNGLMAKGGGPAAMVRQRWRVTGSEW